MLPLPHPMVRALHAQLAGLLWAGLLVLPADAARITIVNNDGPGEGLNDATPAAPLGGNPGTTLGAQRLFVMRHAAQIWGAILSSPVDILVESNFDPLECSTHSGTLGAAGAFTFFRDFDGAPRAATYYPVALANAFAGIDLDPGDPDILARFNSGIGGGGCLSSYDWYYGVDGNAPPGTFDFFDTVLHELAHGLGFISLVNVQTGAKANGYDDVFMLHLEHHATGLLFPDMSNQQRAQAIVSAGNLHWIGDQVVAQSSFLASGRSAEGHVEMYAPSSVQVGSSLSHFSSSLSPDELMEPFANATSDRRLTEALLEDIGWTVQGSLPSIAVEDLLITDESCLSPNGSADPGEVVTVDLLLRNAGTGLTGDLVATLLPSPDITALSSPQHYGILAAGGQAVSRPFTLSAQGACGALATATFQLQDGTNDLGTVAVPLQLGLRPLASHSLSNSAPILIPASGKSGPASPYPSSLQVSGFTTTVSRVALTLHNLSHDFPDNLDILLVGPNGQSALILSDVGGGTDAQGVTLVLDDTAANPVPDAGPLVSGTFQPANAGAGDSFPSPAPSGPFSDALSVFAGADPNGQWRLFILDDSNPNSGVLQGGWTLTLFTELAPVCCEAPPAIADLAVTTSTLANPLSSGTTDILSVRLTNAGPDIALAVSLTGILTGDAALGTLLPSRGFCQATPGGFECQIGQMDPRSVATLSIQLTMGLTGPVQLDLSAATFSSDPVPDNNQAQAATSINSPPTLSGPDSLQLDEDTPSGAVVFVVADMETPVEDLLLSARSSNTNLIPNAALTLAGEGATRSLSFQPLPNQSGTTVLTVTVQDNLASVTDLVFVTVHPVNDPPSLLPIPDQTAYSSQPFQVTAAVADPDSSSFQFELTSAPPGASIGPGTGTITWTPDASAVGLTNRFVVRVADDATPALSDSVSFSVRTLALDAPILQSPSVSGGLVNLVWTAVSGATYRVQYRSTVDDPQWLDLPGDVTASGATAAKSDPEGAPRRFYQVLLLAPPAP